MIGKGSSFDRIHLRVQHLSCDLALAPPWAPGFPAARGDFDAPLAQLIDLSTVTASTDAAYPANELPSRSVLTQG